MGIQRYLDKSMSKLKWTFEACKEVALKCRTKTEFAKTYNGAYQAAKKRKWMSDISGHMIVLGNRYNRCIYVYEFPDNSAYIGLTCNIEERDKAHTKKGEKSKSPVRDHMIKTGLTPKLIQLTDYIDCLKASEEETNWANIYKTNGWILLNKVPTGTLGWKNSFYTKEKCKEILLSYEYQRDVVKNHSNLINLCKVHGWHASIIKKLKLKTNRNNHWNKERCAKIVKTVSSISELSKKNKTAYNAVCRNRWNSELTAHLEGAKKPSGYWDNKELCIELASKSRNITYFFRNFRAAHAASKRNKWLDEFFPKKPTK